METTTTLNELGLNKNSKVYKLVKRIVEGEVTKVYPVQTIGSGKGTRYSDNYGAICNALDALGIQYTTSNESPRGGRLGLRIDIV